MNKKLNRAINQARISPTLAPRYQYPIQAPQLMPRVVPAGVTPQVAQDSFNNYEYAASLAATVGGAGFVPFVGFPGYPYLAMLSTRAEYRMFAESNARELTREWIKLFSTDTEDDSTKEKITQIERDLENIGLRDIIAKMAEHDSYYGRAQMLLKIGNDDLSAPLIPSDKTIGRLDMDKPITEYFKLAAVEAMWTTPLAYNAIDPSRSDFYMPTGWYMVGQKVHADRLLTVVTREVTDMLKPAFNFGGMSMSQLAEPYVDNWLRTRTSVSDLINNFSIIFLKTQMSQLLQGGEEDVAEDISSRVELFNLYRSNKGTFVIDYENEDLGQIAVPLSGLDSLQAQSQEQMCSVSGTPSTILLGVAPTGFGNVSEGEMRAFANRKRAQQVGFWSRPVKKVIEIIQIIRWGAIDNAIGFDWESLYQPTPKEEADLRKSDADRDAAYVTMGAIDPFEVRTKLARDPESGYQGIDITKVPDAGIETEEDDAGHE